ncbi:L-tyrosine/L-tryptophan isonitrile synthase family protein [Kribbella sp. CA-247076]|uniref:L-tyrosine/L-tryptophan isonitrile synthase family protein n=1 Tax=Kribbella sp. CA-247076 TaxID=3239941 RepID=UPI003D8A0A56
MARTVLSAADTERLLHALTDRANRTGRRFARFARRAARPDARRHVVDLLRHVAEPDQDLVTRFMARGEPIRLLAIGFPYKQYDNGLKAAGPRPDLAEVRTLLRFRALRNVVCAFYPPGIRVTILSDGGYYCSRPRADLEAYRSELALLLDRVGVAGFVEVRPLADVLRLAVGPDTWRRRETVIGTFLADVRAAAGPARDGGSGRAVAARMSRRHLDQPGLPGFDAVLESFLDSVPVPGGDVAWTSAVLRSVRELNVGRPLRDARLAVLERAWLDATQYLATATVDERLGILARLPDHLRLVAGPRPGEHDTETHAGTPAWGGTGYVDDHGRVGVAPYEWTLRQGSVPIYSELSGEEQPWFMLHPALASSRSGPLGDLLARITATTL